jgi:hypothetical protein
VAARSNKGRGEVRGQHRPYVKGHNNRKAVRYVESDRGHSSPCWIWQLYCDKDGHGKVTINNKVQFAHVAALEDATGERVADEMVVHHLCEVPSCVNPGHLVALSIAEHMRLHNAKLGWDEVNEMRALYASGARQCDLSRRFGVHAVTVHNVVHEVTWRPA